MKINKKEYSDVSTYWIINQVLDDDKFNNTDDGCLDVFYNIKDMNEAFDSGHITEEGYIGKEILRIGVEYKDSNNITLQMSMKSLLILDDKYEVSSIWSVFEDYVLSFFIDEMKRLLVK